MSEPDMPGPVPASSPRLTARAFLLGERIDTTGLERADTVSLVPFAFRAGEQGVAAFFRYGVAVFIGLSPVEEEDLLAKIGGRVVAPIERREEEIAAIEVSRERGDNIPPGGPIYVVEAATERLLLVADALAKSVVLARAEREVAAVFDVIEPVTRRLASDGRTLGKRRHMVKLIGQALLVQHHTAGRAAVHEKPDILWDRPDLERLHSRLADEYELAERAAALDRKLRVIDDTASAFTDLIDTMRSIRLEWAIVLLIVFEIGLTLLQWSLGRPGH